MAKFRDFRALPLERACNSSSGTPVYEPFVKLWSLSSGNRASIDYTGVCGLLVFDQKDSYPAQHVVVIAKNSADVIFCHTTLASPDFFQYCRDIHRFFYPYVAKLPPISEVSQDL